MDKIDKLSKRFLAGISAVILFVLVFSSLGLGQTAGIQAPQTPLPVTTQAQKPASEEAPAAQPQQPPAAPAQDKTKISPKEAEELFRSVDEILRFASKDTGLPIKHEVKRRLTNRDEVEAYLNKTLAEDKDAQRLRRSELVLKKFGLLPRDFDLQTFMVGLLSEQVAGYYDPKTETVNLLDWLKIEEQRPVMAHELTHALQDQSFGLRKWMKAGDADIIGKKRLTAADIENDEVSSARQAVVEGQAMVVLIDYMLAPMGRSLTDSPQFAEALKADLLVGTADSVQFRSAPIFIKEALIFPYRYGIDFEGQILRAGGKEKAYAGVFTNPPHSTRQIMEPQTYLSGEKIDPLPVVDFLHILKNYEKFDVGAMGEFDVSVLITQYAGAQASRKLYPHWRGGYYYAVHPKGDLAAPLSLLYVSRWANSDWAAQFAAIYAKGLTQRYKKVTAVPDGSAKPEVNLADPVSLTGKHSWMCEEGLVVIDVKNDMVFITEGLDVDIGEQIEQQTFTSVQ